MFKTLNCCDTRTIMECPVVVTKYGKVQGRLCSKLNDTQVFNYSKIPFAKPPVKDLRFKPPQE